MSVSFADTPDLTDEFVAQFQELEQELARYRDNTPTVPTTSPDQLAAVTAEREQLLVERTDLQRRLKTRSNELELANSARDEWQEKWDYANSRIHEMERSLEKEKLLRQQSDATDTKHFPNVSPSPDTESLHQRIRTLQDEKNNWMKLYNDRNDELEQLKRGGSGRQ